MFDPGPLWLPQAWVVFSLIVGAALFRAGVQEGRKGPSPIQVKFPRTPEVDGCSD